MVANAAEPDARSRRKSMIALGIPVDKAVILTRFDADDREDLAAVDVYLHHVLGEKPSEEDVERLRSARGH